MSRRGPGPAPSPERGPAPSPERGAEALLAQLQLTDSGFPSGLYTLSHGLEGYVQLRLVGAEDVRDLVSGVVRAAGTADAAALALTHRAVAAGDWDEVVATDRRLHAIKLTREQRTASVRTGRQVLALAGPAFASEPAERLGRLVAEGAAPGNHAVVVGAVHAGLGVPVRDAVAGDLYALAASCASAAVRLGRSDFRRAQALLRALRPEIVRATEAALAVRHRTELHSSTPLGDVVAAAHERAEARLFIT
ncbi:urease accessory protein [Actinomadura logoneensis]|uniref:Urease accessory protein UreF n=1 Tax=Actinomadura logoneensis TaxID=2293572 RepID=A0A372JML0_9ACTN|nr:urease accessory UreF family protein [Actinomadura logoneensis]RFU40588.1 urease accessory protein [Actinomadura logoneensis]